MRTYWCPTASDSVAIAIAMEAEHGRGSVALCVHDGHRYAVTDRATGKAHGARSIIEAARVAQADVLVITDDRPAQIEPPMPVLYGVNGSRGRGRL